MAKTLTRIDCQLSFQLLSDHGVLAELSQSRFQSRPETFLTIRCVASLLVEGFRLVCSFIQSSLQDLRLRQTVEMILKKTSVSLSPSCKTC